MANKKSTAVSLPKKTFDKKIVLLIGIPFLLYFQTLSHGYIHFDDDLIIEQNMAYLNDYHNVFNAFTTDQFIVKTSSFYRPLGTISYMADVFIGGTTSTWMLHLSNVLLFCLICLALFVLLKKLNFNNTISFWISLMYALHPVLFSSVAHLANRSELMLVLFSLLSFIFWIDFLNSSKIHSLILHFFSFILALFSKETAVVLPFLFLLYYFLYRPNKKLIRSLLLVLIFYVVIGLFWYFLRLIAIKDTPDLNETFGISAFAANLRILPESISVFLFPINVAPIPSFSNLRLILGLLLITFLLVIVLKKKSIHRNIIFFAAAWFLFLMFPSMFYKHPNFDYLNHRFSLPYVGLMIMLIHLLPNDLHFYKKKSSQLLFGIVAASMFILSFANIRMYANPLIFYNACIEKNPMCGIAYNNRGVLLENKGKIDEAIQDYSKTIDLNSNDSRAYYNRGVLYDQKGLIDMALSDYTNAIKAKPDYAEAFLNRGNIYGKLKQFEKAIQDYTNAIQLKPKFALAYNNRGVAWGSLAQYDKEIADYTTSISIEPNNAETYHNRGMAYGNKGQYNLAIEDFSRAIELSPNNPDNYVYRGTVLRVVGKISEACHDFNQAAQLGSLEGKENHMKYCQY